MTVRNGTDMACAYTLLRHAAQTSSSILILVKILRNNKSNALLVAAQEIQCIRTDIAIGI